MRGGSVGARISVEEGFKGGIVMEGNCIEATFA